MPIFDDVGKALKRTSDVIKKTTDGIAKNIAASQENARRKREILNRFVMDDLKKICKEYGIGEPDPYEEFFGERTKKKITRNDYIDYIEERLDLKHIEDFCNNHRIKRQIEVESGVEAQKDHPSRPEPPIVNELRNEENKIQEKTSIVTTANQKPQGETHDILNTIKEQFKPEPCMNEKELQGQLMIWFNIMYPNRVVREVSTMAGKVDFAIDKNRLGLEVKIAFDKGTLRNLVGQILAYKKYFNEVGIILMDVNDMPNSIITEYINEYRNQGVETIVIQGQIRKKKGRPREVRVKY